ncbi:MAG: hypothetical protein E7018_06795 [Alphaproteobacteria bacterium]|nr:hypothetical protein [Alphaproteobacteria bacterium]
MKKLLLSIGLLSGVMLSSTTANAACVAADCAALGYSTATVEGCTRYIVCPFDTSYKACASTSSETTGTMTCEEAVAAAGGIYLGDNMVYRGTIEHTENKDVTYYSHCADIDKIIIKGGGKVTFRRALEISECVGQANTTCGTNERWYAGTVVFGSTSGMPSEIEINWPQKAPTYAETSIGIGSVRLATGATPTISLYADQINIPNLSMTKRPNQPPVIINIESTDTNTSAITSMGLYCLQESTGNCAVMVRMFGDGHFHYKDCQTEGSNAYDGITANTDVTCYTSNGQSECLPLYNYGYDCQYNSANDYL